MPLIIWGIKEKEIKYRYSHNNGISLENKTNILKQKNPFNQNICTFEWYNLFYIGKENIMWSKESHTLINILSTEPFPSQVES